MGLKVGEEKDHACGEGEKEDGNMGLKIITRCSKWSVRGA